MKHFIILLISVTSFADTTCPGGTVLRKTSDKSYCLQDMLRHGPFEFNSTEGKKTGEYHKGFPVGTSTLLGTDGTTTSEEHLSKEAVDIIISIDDRKPTPRSKSCDVAKCSEEETKLFGAEGVRQSYLMYNAAAKEPSANKIAEALVFVSRCYCWVQANPVRQNTFNARENILIANSLVWAMQNTAEEELKRECQTDQDACLALGNWQMKQKSYEEAMRTFEPACERNHEESCKAYKRARSALDKGTEEDQKMASSPACIKARIEAQYCQRKAQVKATSKQVSHQRKVASQGGVFDKATVYGATNLKIEAENHMAGLAKEYQKVAKKSLSNLDCKIEEQGQFAGVNQSHLTKLNSAIIEACGEL